MNISILENLKDRFPQHVPAVLSSFVYILIAIPVYGKDKLAFAFLFLVFITSLFFHSHPENTFFRIGDLIASITFLVYIINKGIQYEHSIIILLIFGLFSGLFWIISEISFLNKFNTFYNVSHTIWHIFSALTILLIVLST